MHALVGLVIACCRHLFDCHNWIFKPHRPRMLIFWCSLVMMDVILKTRRESITAAGSCQTKAKTASIVHDCIAAEVIVGCAMWRTVVYLFNRELRHNAAVFEVVGSR